MRLWYLLMARLRSLLLRTRREVDLDEELRLHLERAIEQRIAAGVPPEDARRQSLVEFGGVEQIKDACRDARGVAPVDTMLRDARHGVRRLVRDWRFSGAAVLILALGIGVNTAMFSAVNAGLFRPQPFSAPDRLVDIYQNGADGSPAANSFPAYLDMASHTDVFSGVTAVLIDGVRYRAEGRVRSAVAEFTTASYLSVLGLPLAAGRWFDPSEDRPGAQAVAVLGHRAWRTQFGADPSAIGSTIYVNGGPVTIVGIGPAGHHGTLSIGVATDFWLSISSMPVVGAPPRALERRPEELAFLVKARLHDGVSVEQARAAMTNLGDRLAVEFPGQDRGYGITLLGPGEVRIHPQVDGALAPVAALLLIIVGLVLAIACSNLATLLLVRGASRSKEMAVRLALGATRGQLVRHLLIESTILSLAGGLAGCILAWWILQIVALLDLPLAVSVSLDYRVLAFTAALALLTGMGFGLAPAVHATRIDVIPALRDEGEALALHRRGFSTKNALVVFQVVASFVLLAGAGFFLRMLIAAQAEDVGFAVDGVAVLETDARYAGYSPSEAQAVAEELRRRVAALPGVEGAILTRGAPMGATGGLFVIDGDEPAAGPAAVVLSWVWAGPGFFETLRIPILRGRAIDDRDGADAPRVAVINESMARRHFGTVDAVGRRFRFEHDPGSWTEVIGVARDAKTAAVLERTRPLFYRPFTQSDRMWSTVVARTSLDATGLVGDMQRELLALDAALPVVTARTMEQYLDDSGLFVPRTAATVMAALGALGLGLASLGLYAIVAFAVSRRSREVGIRMALGARRRQVAWLIAREVAMLMGVAIAIGLGVSLLVGQALRMIDLSNPNLELRAPGADPVMLLAIALLVAAVAMAAACVPARRAATADPLVALRHH